MKYSPAPKSSSAMSAQSGSHTLETIVSQYFSCTVRAETNIVEQLFCQDLHLIFSGWF